MLNLFRDILLDMPFTIQQLIIRNAVSYDILYYMIIVFSRDDGHQTFF